VAKIKGFLNVYRSGHFHRAEKPTAFNRHAGDFYATFEDAFADIDPVSHYIDTVAVEWEDEEGLCANCQSSIPVPLGTEGVDKFGPHGYLPREVLHA
jgi:hypothetical protein